MTLGGGPTGDQKLPFVLAWQAGFREVMPLLRPDTPIEVAIQQCIALGEGKANMVL